MYLTKTPYLLHKFYFPNDLWCIETDQNDIYLTFDDGPEPEVTPWILDLLDQYNAKATFFCVGNNVGNNPELFSDILRRGHSIGNHTYSHVNGWKSNLYNYFLNVKKCNRHFKTNLFRPPYGKISSRQRALLTKHFRLIYWTVISGDFDKTISPEICLEKTISSTEKGAIVVFHDSQKAKKNLTFALPAFLKHFHNKGFSFKAIPFETDNLKPAPVLNSI